VRDDRVCGALRSQRRGRWLRKQSVVGLFGMFGNMRKKLLIVEDNSELLELFRLSLKDAGFTVTTAANGVEALAKARATVPDLIVLDLVLPELDGFAVCEALRREEATSAKPILALTGLSSEFARFAGLESGADEFVTKPVSPDHLVSRIRHWLKQPLTPRARHPETKTRVPSPAGRTY
jgi:DNA-binding response OmpR family regulator